MNLTTEQIQAILDGTPEGATHVDIEGDYWVMQETQAQFWCDNFEWSYAEPQEPLHNLSDLGEILTLRQRIEELESDWNLEHYHRLAVEEENERLKAQQSEVAARAVKHGFRCAVALQNNPDVKPLGIDVYANRVANLYVKTMNLFKELGDE